MIRNSFFAGLFSLLLAACGQMKPNPDPISNIDYYDTRELQEMRESYTADLESYKGPPSAMTNRQKLPELKDEMEAHIQRKLVQIQKELQRRYAAGDKDAYYAGMDGTPAQPAPVTPMPAAAPAPAPAPANTP